MYEVVMLSVVVGKYIYLSYTIISTVQLINQILFVQQRDQAAVIINAMLNRNDKAMKALTVTLM